MAKSMIGLLRAVVSEIKAERAVVSTRCSCQQLDHEIELMEEATQIIQKRMRPSIAVSTAEGVPRQLTFDDVPSHTPCESDS